MLTWRRVRHDIHPISALIALFAANLWTPRNRRIALQLDRVDFYNVMCGHDQRLVVS